MNDSYTEHLIKRTTPIYMKLATALLSIATLLFLFLALTTDILSMILMLISAALTYVLFQNTNIEYEYLYISGQLTIDKILGRARRKKAWEGSMENVVIIAPSDSYVLNDHKLQSPKRLDFSSAAPHAKTYTVLYQSNGTNYEIILEPSEKMLQSFRQTSPRKVIL